MLKPLVFLLLGSNTHKLSNGNCMTYIFSIWNSICKVLLSQKQLDKCTCRVHLFILCQRWLWNGFQLWQWGVGSHRVPISWPIPWNSEHSEKGDGVLLFAIEIIGCFEAGFKIKYSHEPAYRRMSSNVAVHVLVHTHLLSCKHGSAQHRVESVRCRRLIALQTCMTWHWSMGHSGRMLQRATRLGF